VSWSTIICALERERHSNILSSPFHSKLINVGGLGRENSQYIKSRGGIKLKISQQSSDGIFVASGIIFIVYALASMLGVITKFAGVFPGETWLGSWINLAVSLLLMVIWAIVCLDHLLSGIMKTYESLGDVEREKVNGFLKKLGKTLFSLAKKHQGKIGEFARTWEKH
jgi:hypothetical protein